MYSPAARPSSMRAAPAKNRIWSTIGGISSLAVSPSGLPVFCALQRDQLVGVLLDRVGELAAAPAAARAGVVSRQVSNAAAAAGVGPVDVGRRRTPAPGEHLAGRRVDQVGACGRRPASTDSPPTKLRSARLLAHGVLLEVGRMVCTPPPERPAVNGNGGCRVPGHDIRRPGRSLRRWPAPAGARRAGAGPAGRRAPRAPRRRGRGRHPATRRDAVR